MQNAQTRSAGKFLVNRNGETGSEISVLVALFLFSLLILAAYLVAINNSVIIGEVGSFFSELNKQKNHRFQIGEIKLGTSLAKLKASRPDIEIGINATGRITATYKEGGATYTALYEKSGSRSFSYQSRYDNAFTSIDEEAIIGEIAERYGVPSTDSCNARITEGMRACRFTWWLPDNLRLDIATRKPIDAKSDKYKINVTMIATDTRLKGRVQRTAIGGDGLLIRGGVLR